MNDNKPLPSVEYSLKSVSWHLKTISEEIKVLNQTLSVLLDRPSAHHQPRSASNEGFPF